MPTTHPRHYRRLGSHVARPIPENLLPWMLADPTALPAPEEEGDQDLTELNNICTDSESEMSETY